MLAERVSATLEPHIRDSRDVVVVEPSDHALFEREYKRLLDEASFERLASNAYEVMEVVYGLLENGAPAGAFTRGNGEAITYHSHCQQRTLGLEPHTVAVLEDLGYDVVTSDIECCGIAGRLTDDARDRTVVASGTSCLGQLGDLLERPT